MGLLGVWSQILVLYQCSGDVSINVYKPDVWNKAGLSELSAYDGHWPENFALFKQRKYASFVEQRSIKGPELHI